MGLRQEGRAVLYTYTRILQEGGLCGVKKITDSAVYYVNYHTTQNQDCGF
jgi:hypothetical protein